MKTGTATRTLEHNVEGTTKKAQISGSAAMFDILYNRMYTEKEWAIFRELFSNAWDSHRRADTLDTPVSIHLPTSLEPWFAIRDYGVGLSPEAVQTLFMNYGESDKNQSNDEIGGFGLGSKTPYAYTDQFTVKSFWNGHCYVFQAYLLEDGCPSSTLLASQPTDEPNGLEITVNVDSERGREMFTHSLKRMYSYIPTRPRLNYTPKDLQEEEYEYVFDNPDIEGVQCVAVTTRGSGHRMNSKDIRFVLDIVPYSLDRDDLDRTYQESDFIRSVLTSRRVDIWLDTGVLDVTAPRESISMDNDNKNMAGHLFSRSMDLLLKLTVKEAEQCKTWYEWVPYQKLLPNGYMTPPNGIADLTDGRSGTHVPIYRFGPDVTAKKYYHPTSARFKSPWTSESVAEFGRDLIDKATLYYRPKDQWPVKAFMDQQFKPWHDGGGPIIVFNHGDPDTIRAKLKELGISNELHELPFIKKAPGQKKVYSPKEYPTWTWHYSTQHEKWLCDNINWDKNLQAMEDTVSNDTLVIATEFRVTWQPLIHLLDAEGGDVSISQVLIAEIPERHTRVRRQLLEMTGYGIDDIRQTCNTIPGVDIDAALLQAFANFHSFNVDTLEMDPHSLREWLKIFPLGEGRTSLHRFAQACSQVRDVITPKWWTGIESGRGVEDIHRLLKRVRLLPEPEPEARQLVEQAIDAMHTQRERIETEYPDTLSRLVKPRPYGTSDVCGRVIEELAKYIPEE